MFIQYTSKFFLNLMNFLSFVELEFLYDFYLIKTYEMPYFVDKHNITTEIEPLSIVLALHDLLYKLLSKLNQSV